MPRQKRSEEAAESTVLFIRGMPREVLAKMKAAAALNRRTLSQYVLELFDAHLREVERKGLWPKGKG